MLCELRDFRSSAVSEPRDRAFLEVRDALLSSRFAADAEGLLLDEETVLVVLEDRFTRLPLCLDEVSAEVGELDMEL